MLEDDCHSTEGAVAIAMKLIIGNRNYSSWSLRAWLAVRITGADCEVLRVPLYEPESRSTLARLSPTGKVPVLETDHGVIWDSLAISEYLAECFPHSPLLPREPRSRAVARSVCAEMHSGFVALRAALPMDMQKDERCTIDNEAVQADIERILELWAYCRERFGKNGNYLFDQPSLADAFFAPIASRFRSYRVELPGAAMDYVEAIHEWPAFSEWRQLALAEKEVFKP